MTGVILKRRSGHTEVDREARARAQGEDGHLQPRGGVRRKQHCQHVDLGLLVFRIVRK